MRKGHCACLQPAEHQVGEANSAKLLQSGAPCQLRNALHQHTCRQGFKHVVSAANQLIEALKARGPAREVDIDNMAQRVTMEVRLHGVQHGCFCRCGCRVALCNIRLADACVVRAAKVIGQVGFGKGFGSLDDIDRDNKVFRLVASGEETLTPMHVRVHPAAQTCMDNVGECHTCRPGGEHSALCEPSAASHVLGPGELMLQGWCWLAPFCSIAD